MLVAGLASEPGHRLHSEEKGRVLWFWAGPDASKHRSLEAIRNHEACAGLNARARVRKIPPLNDKVLESHVAGVVGKGSQISDNHSTGNGFSGISSISGNGNRIEGNHLWGNSSMGIYIGGPGNILVRNTASSNTQGSFSVVGGNVAPVENGTLTNVASNVSF